MIEPDWDRKHFEAAFRRTVGHEGELSLDINDSGNWTSGKVGEGRLAGTKFGISAAAYPDIDIVNLTLNDARQIYFADYWIPSVRLCRKMGMPNAMYYQIFDAAVHSGNGGARRMLLRALGQRDTTPFDELSHLVIPPSLKPSGLVMLFLSERTTTLTNISAWRHFHKGWTRRMAQNLRYAAHDLGHA